MNKVECLERARIITRRINKNSNKGKYTLEIYYMLLSKNGLR